MAQLAGIERPQWHSDRRHCRRHVHCPRALQAGPAGTLLITGRWASAENSRMVAQALSRLLNATGRTCKIEVDVLIVDSGSGMTRGPIGFGNEQRWC